MMPRRRLCWATLRTGGCTTVVNVAALYASGQISTKCTIYHGWVHNSPPFQRECNISRVCRVILTKNRTFGIVKNLFRDLAVLVP
jgi:hypothetical protein